MSPETESVRRARDTSEPDTVLTFVKDNLEAIAVAIVMALVIKHFCVEAFKIPTSSMRPTLLGESDNEQGEGDRILVDKFAYLFSSPSRWDVIVFRYPLNMARNFIKRIAGLPGEHLRISDDGDLWVKRAGKEHGDDELHIPQKPPRVREQFYRAVYPPLPPEPDEDDEKSTTIPATLSHFWRIDGGVPNAWRLESHAEFVYNGGRAAALRNVASILEHTTPRSWPSSSNAGELVRDARFAMRVTLDAPKKEGEDTSSRFTLRWRPDASFLAVITLSSKAGTSEAFVRRDTQVVKQAALDVVLEAGTSYDVVLEYVDGHLRAHVDGKELAVLADGRTFSDTLDEAGDQRFTIEAEGHGLKVQDLAIARDLRYENSWDANPSAERRGIDIPDGRYFMLGDNTSNSSDSRRWRMVTVHIRGGGTIRHDHSDSPEYLKSGNGDLSLKRVTDADGIVRTWNENDEDTDKGSETNAAPFVDSDLIVGRAFLVFWPCWPKFPGRLGFIH